MVRKRQFLFAVGTLLTVCVLADLYRPVKSDFQAFNPAEVGRLETDMWRSYYEKRPVRLFFQLAQLVRSEFQAPFWRSYRIAFSAAKAAFLFKEGKNRTDYAQALPDLERFYGLLSDLSGTGFNAKLVAQQELEWWIIRRERTRYAPAAWERILAREAAEIHRLPAERFTRHAHLRVRAMLLRDAWGGTVTDANWQQINALLQESWTELQRAAKGKV